MNKEAGTASPRILIAPLDWGLGHATRCIPIIRKLSGKADVIIAAEGRTETLLKAEFPSHQFIPLQGYNVQYGSNSWETKAKLLLQIPRLIRRVEDEFDWLDKMIEEHRLDAVVSDNRYGLYSEKIPSVFITHQLLIKTGLGATADSMLQKLHGHFISAFDECWVPDYEGPHTLSGELGHPPASPKFLLHYIGPQSRFSEPMQGDQKHILVLLSGPEPQRSLLEDLVLQQMAGYPGEVILVRGLPGETGLPGAGNIKIYNHLPAAELQAIIEQASLVIARCGYSTVMDMMVLKKKTILIPTPGQTEQEYLARHLMEHNHALCFEQNDLQLLKAISLAGNYDYQFPGKMEDAPLDKAVNGLLNLVKQRSVSTLNVP